MWLYSRLPLDVVISCALVDSSGAHGTQGPLLEPRATLQRPFFQVWYSHIKDKTLRDRLIFNMGIPILVRRSLFIETSPWFPSQECVMPNTFQFNCLKSPDSVDFFSTKTPWKSAFGGKILIYFPLISLPNGHILPKEFTYLLRMG